MLDTIRQLSRTVKLKDVIIGSFIPEDSAKGVERRAVWSQEEDCWTVQKLVCYSYKIVHLFSKCSMIYVEIFWLAFLKLF